MAIAGKGARSVNGERVAERVSVGLRLGTGKTVITPPVGSDLSGFIARTAPMAGIHDDLYARAMVWVEEGSSAVAALLTLDLIDLDAASVTAIRDRATALTGIPAAQIGVTCTHTHGGPATPAGRWLGQYSPEYLATLCATAAGAVAIAASYTESVVMRWACGTEQTVGKNRRIAGGVIDPDVPVLRFARHDGTVAAVLTSYACHPVTLGPDNLLATADYPGYVVRTLEATYPGALALFATGACGQINTGHTARDGVQGRGNVWRTYVEAERLGRTVAGAAMQAAEAAARDDAARPGSVHPIRHARVRTARRTVPMPMLPIATPTEAHVLADGWRAERERLAHAGANAGETGPYRVGEEWAAALVAGTLPTTITAEIMVIALGDVALVLLPGEVFVEYGLAIKAHAAPRPVITLAYANGTPGYIPHRSAYAEGGYEVADAYRYYGTPACFAPEAGEAVVAAACALLDALVDAPTISDTRRPINHE